MLPHMTREERLAAEAVAAAEVEAYERWLRDWLAGGFAELGAYLARHQAYGRWCDEQGMAA